jgi:AraC-like DNA-binding protein
MFPLSNLGKNRKAAVLLNSLRFTDFDAFADSIRDVDARMTLQNPCDRAWAVDQVCFTGIDLQVGRLGSGNIVEGQSRSDGIMFYLPMSREVEYKVNGKAFWESKLMVLEPGAVFCLSTKLPHNWCSIFIQTNKVALDLVENPLSEPAASQTARCRVETLTDQFVVQVRAIVNEIMIASRDLCEFESSPAAEFASQTLIRLVNPVLIKSLGQTGETSYKGRPTIARSDIIRSCQEFIESRAGSHTNLGQLVSMTDVSERTLRQAFHDYYGIGPARYLQLRQLHHVRRKLAKADPKMTSVGHLLSEAGVWELGRFAGRYRQLFDELPSQTLGKTI